MSQTRTLLLLRHAKSSWDDPSLADHDRPLAPRGRRAAERIGELLRDQGIEISLVLCSSARRARETLELAQPPGEVQIEQELYGASARQLLDRIRRVPDEVESLMLIGHNPAVEELALGLAADRSELEGAKFPTGALVTFSVNEPWQGLAPGEATLTGFVKPRDLE